MSPAGPSPFAYTWTPAHPLARSGTNISTSRTELAHIAIAFAVLTVDITFLLGGSGVFSGAPEAGSLRPTWTLLVLVAAAATFTGFVAHELAHKVVAQRRGYWAEFRVSWFGLLLSLVSTFVFGVLFAAPGATVVSGMSPADREGWGRTGLAGPLTNVAFAVAFYLGAIALYVGHSPQFGWLLLLALLNSWFAAFNLIPVGPLDGRKVFGWNVGYWAAAIAGTGALAAVSFFAFQYATPLFGY